MPPTRVHPVRLPGLPAISYRVGERRPEGHIPPERMDDAEWAAKVIRDQVGRTLDVTPGGETWHKLQLAYLVDDRILTQQQLNDGMHYAQHQAWIANHISNKKGNPPEGIPGGDQQWFLPTDEQRGRLLH